MDSSAALAGCAAPGAEKCAADSTRSSSKHDSATSRPDPSPPGGIRPPAARRAPRGRGRGQARPRRGVRRPRRRFNAHAARGRWQRSSRNEAGAAAGCEVNPARVLSWHCTRSRPVLLLPLLPAPPALSVLARALRSHRRHGAGHELARRAAATPYRRAARKGASAAPLRAAHGGHAARPKERRAGRGRSGDRLLRLRACPVWRMSRLVCACSHAIRSRRC
jgi:hypothetical protein